MSTSINDLPVEILADIMRRVQEVSIGSVMLTCKKWKDVVDKHLSQTVHLTTYMYAIDILSSTFNSETKSKIHKMILDDLTECNDREVIYICEQIGGRVTQLDWFQGRGVAVIDSMIPSVLKHLPNLERIHFMDVWTAGVPEHCELPELTKLKTLHITNCSGAIFTFFQTSNLEALILDSEKLSRRGLHHVQDFVERQKNLTKLELDEEATFLMDLYPLNPNGDKISHFTVCNSDVSFIDELYRFIVALSDTLTNLDLYTRFSNTICEAIFIRLKSLKHLSINLEDQVELNRNGWKNMSIESLEFKAFKFSPQALEAFCRRVPNVKYLSSWHDWNAEQLRIISTTLPKLTALYVRSFNESLGGIKFPNLTSFRIDFLEKRFDWDAFIETNSAITEIIVGNVRFCGKNLHNVETFTRNLILKEETENFQPTVHEYPKLDWLPPESSELV